MIRPLILYPQHQCVTKKKELKYDKISHTIFLLIFFYISFISYFASILFFFQQPENIFCNIKHLFSYYGARRTFTLFISSLFSVVTYIRNNNAERCFRIFTICCCCSCLCYGFHSHCQQLWVRHFIISKVNDRCKGHFLSRKEANLKSIFLPQLGMLKVKKYFLSFIFCHILVIHVIRHIIV